MRFMQTAILTTTLLSMGAFKAYADVKVVASIKPVHSLVSFVMKGAGEPVLLVDGAGSPHNYALKPSQARQLQNADIVFWVGHDLEAFLENSIETIASKAVSVPLIDAHGLIKLGFREGGAFDSHDHDDHNDGHHDQHDHDEHGHDVHKDDHHEEHGDDHHDEHGQDEHGHDEHGHDDHNDGHHDEHDHDDLKEEHDHDDHASHDHEAHDHKVHDHKVHDHGAHDHGAFDSHIWLDPQNAKVLVHEIEEHLVAIDPQNAALYETNADTLMTELDNLILEIDTELAPIRGRGYLVFHDAYQYFEKRFGIPAIGSITVSPEVMPGAERINDLQDKVRSLDAVCVFSEPQFQPKLVSTVTENTKAGTGVLDPLGASIEAGPDLYTSLIRSMAASLKSCLQKTS